MIQELGKMIKLVKLYVLGGDKGGFKDKKK